MGASLAMGARNKSTLDKFVKIMWDYVDVGSTEKVVIEQLFELNSERGFFTFESWFNDRLRAQLEGWEDRNKIKYKNWDPNTRELNEFGPTRPPAMTNQLQELGVVRETCWERTKRAPPRILRRLVRGLGFLPEGP